MKDYTSVANILKKLHDNGLINWQYIMKCPHCGEISYQLVERDINTPKLCDTCQIIYKLTDGSTLEK
jgi:formylmethanofuran dehydrogenase subunit E